MQLQAYELRIEDPIVRRITVERLRNRPQAPYLVLDTCQRLECYGFSAPDVPGDHIVSQSDAEVAFERLTRIAAGLESRILGELEVLGQVREAYKLFRATGGSDDTRLDRVFQDILSLAREARRESGIDRNLISLSAVAATALLEKVPAASPLAVIGTGSLASSVARYIGKKGGHPLKVSGRCPENALSIASEVGAFSSGLDALAPMLKDVAGVITATAAPHAIVYAQHIEHAARPLVIIDLGVPPDCHDAVPKMAGVTYLSLADIEARAQVNVEDRRQRGEVAARIIRDGVLAWSRKN